MMNQNLTFAAFKHPKEGSQPRATLSRKNQLPLNTFKALNEGKDKNAGAGKRFDNQENTLWNFQGTGQVRKNMVKVDKSNKKNIGRTFKSPLNKNWQNVNQSVPESNQPKLIFKASLRAKGPLTINTSRNEPIHMSAATVMTPSLSKNRQNKDDQLNASFLTQKHSLMSDHGSISSNKNSLNDSFFNANNVSMEDMGQNVNSSIDMPVNSCQIVREFHVERELASMKKSQLCCKDGESVLKDLDLQSNVSVASSRPSTKISEKFQHHKKNAAMSMYRPSKPESRKFCLQDFERLAEIGSGKYGKVHLARHKKSGFICALKQVSKQIIRSQNLQIPFIRQIKIQLYLSHPNIVQLYGMFHDNESVYLIMQYCSDNHLLKLIKEQRQFRQDEIIFILGNIFEAVSYIHCNGVIHRDIKPENVVVQHGVYKLCDFGWAAYACGDVRSTFCGTPLYVCPEVLKGEMYNQKADIWGLGVLTYQLTFGQVPFTIFGESDLVKIVKDPVYFPARSQTSQKLVDFMRKMLSKEASQRPSLNEILSDPLFKALRPQSDSPAVKELSTIY